MSRHATRLEPGAPIGSVVIVNYNGGEKLLRCIRSVLSNLPAEVEVVLVDNGSSDGSAEAAARESPEVVFVKSDSNLGFGGGSNLGASRARGGLLAFLNPDTIVEPTWLGPLFDHIGRDRRALVTPKILLAADPGRINTCGNDVHVTGLALTRGFGQPRNLFAEREEVGAVSGAAFAIQRELFEQLGGFDEEFFLYVEDTDLSWRARLLGGLCVHEPKSVVLHDYTFRLTSLKVFHQERNRYLMLLKCLRWPTLAILFPALVLAEVVTWGFVFARDRSNARNKLRAYAWVVSNWRTILRKRRVVQGSRRIPDRVLIRTTGFRLDFGQVASPALATVARVVFDPLFFLLRGLALALIWW